MTLLIRNVRILGGAEKFSEPRDIFINGDKISAIGSFPSKGADEVIDGGGAYIAPGFIDVNTDSDHYLSVFNYPEQDDFLRQGVTTIIGGMCGSSLAPLLYGSLESLQKWGDISKVNVNWHSVAEFFQIFERKPLAVNFATLIGHATVRRAIVGEEMRELTKNELAVFGKTLRRALEEGGAGLSTGLSYVHSFKATYPEIKFLANIVKDLNGVYATHLRKSGSELMESVDETLRLAKETGAKTTISHFMPLLGAEKEYETALEKIESLSSDIDLNFDIYPFDRSVLALYTFLPAWVQSGGREVMLANVRDEWMRPRIEKDILIKDPENFIVAQAPGNDFLVGKSLVEIGDTFNISDYRSALLKLMNITDLRGIIFYKNINKKLIGRAMKSPRSMIASNAASFKETTLPKVIKPERSRSTFTGFLSKSLSEQLMSLEDAIKKITIEPAKKFNFKSRGLIKEGNFADLVVFSLGEVHKEGVTTTESEIRYTIVNGVAAFKNNAFAGKFFGRILKHNAG